MVEDGNEEGFSFTGAGAAGDNGVVPGEDLRDRLLLRVETPLAKGGMAHSSFVSKLASGEQSRVKVKCGGLRGERLVGHLVGALQRKIGTAPEQVDAFDVGVHLLAQVIANDGKGGLDVALVRRLDALNDVERLHKYNLGGVKTFV